MVIRWLGKREVICDLSRRLKVRNTGLRYLGTSHYVFGTLSRIITEVARYLETDRQTLFQELFEDR